MARGASCHHTRIGRPTHGGTGDGTSGGRSGRRGATGCHGESGRSDACPRSRGCRGRATQRRCASDIRVDRTRDFQSPHQTGPTDTWSDGLVWPWPLWPNFGRDLQTTMRRHRAPEARPGLSRYPRGKVSTEAGQLQYRRLAWWLAESRDRAQPPEIPFEGWEGVAGSRSGT